MDITPVFGTVVPGSNPGGSTKNNKQSVCFLCFRVHELLHVRPGFESPEHAPGFLDCSQSFETAVL